MKRLAKYFSLILLALIVLVVLAGFFVQTSLFKNWLKDKVVTAAQTQINGRLSIGSLEGNLFTHVFLMDIVVRQESGTIIEIPGIFVGYQPLGLLSKQIVIQEFIVENPRITLSKQEQGNWNILELVKSSNTGVETPQDTTSSRFDWMIDVRSFQIHSGQADFSGKPTPGIQIPERIENIELDVKFVYSTDVIELTLENFTFKGINPDFNLSSLQSELKISPNGMRVSDLLLETGASKLQLDAKIQDFADPVIDASLQAGRLSLTELKQILNELPLQGTVRFSTKIEGPLNDLALGLELWLKNGNAEIAGVLKVDEKPYGYRLKSSFKDIDLAEITGKKELESDLDVAFDIEGSGTEIGKINADFAVNVDTSRILDRTFERISLRGQAHGDSVGFHANLSALGADSRLSGYFSSGHKAKAYALTGNVLGLNLEEITGDSSLFSNISFDFTLEGTGLAPESLNGRAVLHVASSQFFEIPIDTAYARLTVSDQLIKIGDLRFESPLAQTTIDGNLGIGRPGQVSFDAESIDLSVAADLFGMDSLGGAGSFSGQLTGSLDSLSVDTQIDFKELNISNVEIGELGGELTGRHSDKLNSFRFRGKALQAQAFGTRNLESELDLSYQDSLIHYSIKLARGETFSAETRGEVLMMAEGYRLTLGDLGFDVIGQTWQKVGLPTEIRYRNSELDVSELTLSSGEQSITISGGLGTNGRSDLRMKIAELDFAKILEMNNPAPEFSGRLDFEVNLTGKLASPEIRGDFSISDGRYFDSSFNKLKGGFGYQNNRFDARLLLSESEGDTLARFYGSLPYILSLLPFENELLSSDSVEIGFNTPGLNLAFVQGFTRGIENLDGNLVSDIVLHNTLQDLSGSGAIRLQNGRFDIPELGLKLRDIEVDLGLRDKEVVVNDLRIRSGGGDLKIVDGSLSLSQQSVDTFQVHLQADNLKAISTNGLDAVVEGDLDMAGSVQEIELDGDLTVVAAEIYYPAFVQSESAVELTSRPFFIIVDDTTEFDSSGALRFQETSVEMTTPFTETEFYRNIRGNLSLTIDRNTWLRSEEANIEVQGNLEMRKEGADFVLFGSVSTVRGYYELQGRRFQIVDGEITFKGDPEFNPNLQISAIYEFTNQFDKDSEDRRVEVVISGTKEAPQFEFTIDEQPADHKDVLAILLFGKTFDELTISEGNTVSEQSSLSEQSQGFFAGQVMERLSRRIGDELNLDVLQVESGEALRDTKVRVGKYVTDDVFVSVTQDFGAEGDQKVKLEYKLPEDIVILNLFLQALKERQGDTAMDVIWKFEW